MKRALTLLITAASLAACTPKPPKVSIVKPSGHSVSVAVLQRVNSAAYNCWAKDIAFKPYGIVPELDTTGTPRILIIPKGKPQALPKLVITATGSSVQTFGPLAQSDLSSRINSDVARWAAGGKGCAV